MSGNVTVSNPNPEDALVVPVTDTLLDEFDAPLGIEVVLDCGLIVPVAGEYTIPAGSSMVCDYSVEDADRAGCQ